jgi:plasmid stabilization system protein ParE
MFRVEWLQSALDELASVWSQAGSATRAAITNAANQLEMALRAHPDGVGESRPGGRRIAFFAPLGVTFRKESDGRTITILTVWNFRQNS